LPGDALTGWAGDTIAARALVEMSRPDGSIGTVTRYRGNGSYVRFGDFSNQGGQPVMFSAWVKRGPTADAGLIEMDAVDYSARDVVLTTEWQLLSVYGIPPMPYGSSYRFGDFTINTSADVYVCWVLIEMSPASAVLPGAWFEGATIAPPFGGVVSVAANGPRIQYESNGLARGLLVERERPQLLADSNDFSGYALDSVVLTPAAALSPRGLATLATIVAPAATALFCKSGLVAAGNGVAMSLCARKNAGSPPGIFGFYNTSSGSDLAYMVIDWSAGTFTVNGPQSAFTIASLDVMGEWFELNFAVTAGITTGNGFNAYLGAVGSPASVGSSWYVAGFDVTSGVTFPGSYVQTSGGAATRGLELASASLASIGMSGAVGALLVDFIAGTFDGSSYGVASVTQAGPYYMGVYLAGGDTITIEVYTASGPGGGATIRDEYHGFTKGQRVKAALTWSAGRFQTAVNGRAAAVSSGNGGTAHTGADTLMIGSLGTTGGYGGGDSVIAAVKGWDRLLSERELLEVTSS
jgi:hypothetical protein